jgi:hypothetical protein
MIRRMAHGWQVMLADLSLILFITTAASLVAQEDAGGSLAEGSSEIAGAAVETPVIGVFRAGGETSLANWLQTRATDAREALTIEAHYTGGGRDAALTAAGALAQEAEDAGFRARIVVQPGARDEALALFAFEGDPALARPLHRAGALADD